MKTWKGVANCKGKVDGTSQAWTLLKKLDESTAPPGARQTYNNKMEELEEFER